MHLLKQSTAASVLVGPVLDSTGAVITAAVIGDFNITKNGTSAAMASAATATHDHNGMYIIALTTGNTDTLGRLVISYNGTAHAGVMAAKSLEILSAATFDAIITNAAGTANGLPLSLASAKVTAVLNATDVTGNLPSNTIQVGGTAVFSYDGGITSATSSSVVLASTDAAGVTIPDNAHAYSVLQIVAGTGADQLVRLTTRTGVRTYNVDTTSMPTTLDNTSKWIFAGTWNSTPTSLPVGTGAGQISLSSGAVLLQPTQTGVTIPTVTTLTNLPAISTNWLTGTGVDATAVTKIQAGLATPTNITAGTITTVTNLTNLPAISTNWLTGTGVDATAVTKIQAGLATPTNITAGTITTVTNLTNAPTAGDLTATMKTSVTTAASAATPTANLNLAQTLSAFGSALTSSTTDTSLTVNQALHSAIATVAGQQTTSGTTYVTKTSQGTTIRSLTLDQNPNPTSRS